jgi:hypothetical protein
MQEKPSRRVLVIGRGSVMDEGIRGLLMSELSLQIATASSVDLATYIKAFGTRVPDVIVTSESNPLDWTGISELLHRISPTEMLRVIIVRLEDNTLEVYDKQSLKMTRNEDLISLIKA